MPTRLFRRTDKWITASSRCRRKGGAAEEEPAPTVAVPSGTGGRVAVLGDASGSMEVAINTATILGSLLSVCLNADLRFFNDGSFPPPSMPGKAAEVLTVTEQVPAVGLTSPAVALRPYFEEAKDGTEPPVDLFIVVSDEEENTPDPATGKSFAQLFKQYQAEVNPHSKCFLVSFLSNSQPNFLGKMRASLRSEGLNCKQFRLDARRPDLTKLTSLLALLKLELNSGMKLSQAVGEVDTAAVQAAIADAPPPPPAGGGEGAEPISWAQPAQASLAPAEVSAAAAHVEASPMAQAEVVSEADEIAKLKAELEAVKLEAAKAKKEAEDLRASKAAEGGGA